MAGADVPEPVLSQPGASPRPPELWPVQMGCGQLAKATNCASGALDSSGAAALSQPVGMVRACAAVGIAITLRWAAMSAARTMANPEQLAQYIRYALSSLAEQNSHHAFEHICRHYSRARIARNILPATGPVSAGGDQGRDFETFRSHVPAEPPGILAPTTGSTVVFACTTTKAPKVPGKIRSDVAAIMAAADKVDEIHFFCTIGMPSARRHELQAEIRTKYSVMLEIHDVDALGQDLADEDLFWIAQHYLSLPAEMRPDSAPEESGWYVTARSRWASRDMAPATFGDFADIELGLRCATSDHHADLPFWSSLMAEMVTAADVRLRQRARYELARAALRGANDLRPVEAEVRAFFDQAMEEAVPALLEDASNLLTYCGSARRWHLTTFSADEILAWNSRLREHIRHLLEQNPSPSHRCALLDVLGQLGAQQDITQDSETEPPPYPPPTVQETAAVLAGDLHFLPIDRPIVFVDIDEAMGAWEELVGLLPEARMFPLKRITESFVLMTPFFVAHPSYGRIRDALDERVAAVSGRAAVAAACYRRAKGLYDAGQRLAALGELHKARVDWWAGDTLREAVNAMLMISNIYMELRLPTAARYYALTAARAADVNGDELLLAIIPQAFAQAARADHLAGTWWTEAFMFDLITTVHIELVDQSFHEYPYLRQLLTHAAQVLRCSRVLGPPLQHGIDGLLMAADMLPVLNDVLLDNPEVNTWSKQQWLDAADEHLCGRPFCDVGPVRVLRWNALGLDWTVRARNDKADVLAAERLTAMAQILSAELVEQDLVLIPSAIDVFVEVLSSDAPVREAWVSSSATERCWKVQLTAYEGPGTLDHERAFTETFAALANILADVSLLARDAVMDALTAAFGGGLIQKLLVGASYDEVANVLPDDAYGPRSLKYAEPLGSAVKHPAHAAPDLPWRTGPGPTYTTTRADELLRSRYERFPELLSFTLPILRADHAFRTLVATLRSEGWLDWHILTAVLGIVTNYRLDLDSMLDDTPSEAQHQEMNRRALAPETSEMPQVPTSLFTRAAMEDTRELSTLVLLKRWRLTCDQDPPDYSPITRLLAERYGYWSDDVEHADPF